MPRRFALIAAANSHNKKGGVEGQIGDVGRMLAQVQNKTRALEEKLASQAGDGSRSLDHVRRPLARCGLTCAHGTARCLLTSSAGGERCKTFIAA